MTDDWRGPGRKDSAEQGKHYRVGHSEIEQDRIGPQLLGLERMTDDWKETEERDSGGQWKHGREGLIAIEQDGIDPHFESTKEKLAPVKSDRAEQSKGNMVRKGRIECNLSDRLQP